MSSFSKLKKLFLVRVPTISTYTDFEIENCGLPITIDLVSGKTLNNKAYNDLTTCMLPLIRLIEIYCNGYSIHIVNKEDSTEIYTILSEYLNTVNNSYNLNASTVSKKEQENIKKFASEIFNLNKAAIVKELTPKVTTLNDVQLMRPTKVIKNSINVLATNSGNVGNNSYKDVYTTTPDFNISYRKTTKIERR